jgi:hypothetical protein
MNQTIMTLSAIRRRLAHGAGTVRITGTPTFVVGKAANDSVEGKRVVGARDFRVFEEQIVKALGEQQAAAK